MRTRLESSLILLLALAVGCDSKKQSTSHDRRSLGLDFNSITSAVLHSAKRGRIQLDEQTRARLILALRETEMSGPFPIPETPTAPQPEVFLDLELGDGTSRRFGILGSCLSDPFSKRNWPFDYGVTLMGLGGYELSNP
jgi:hypothetical protein